MTSSLPIAPTLHLNGTSGKDLYAEYHAAYKALKAAEEALCLTTCNGRDFYPQGPRAFYQARNERQAAITKLRETKAYVEGVLMGIMDQM